MTLPLPAKQDPARIRNMRKLVTYTRDNFHCNFHFISFKLLNTDINALAIQVGTIFNRNTFVEFSVNHLSSRAVTAGGAYSYACQFIHIVTSEGTGPGTS